MAPKARILAIDPQPYFRRLLETLLMEDGYAVRTAAPGAAAAAELDREGPFELVIADLSVADSDGLEAIHALVEHGSTGSVLVLSALSDARVAVEAMKRGAAEYLLKPVDRETLLGAVAALLAGARPLAKLPAAAAAPAAGRSRRRSADPGLRPLDVGRALVELLCREAGVPDAVLWMRADDGALRRSFACGGRVADGEPDPAASDLAELEAEPASGQPVPGQIPGRGAGLRVPCLYEGRLLAVVELSGGEPSVGLATDRIEACRRLAEIGALAIASAERGIALEGSAFREPRTGLPGREFLELLIQTEIHRAHRYGRRIAFVCVALDGLPSGVADATLQEAVARVLAGLRLTDVLAAEDADHLWLVAGETDPLGGVVLKRRLADRFAEALREVGIEGTVRLASANYPLDGETVAELRLAARRGLEAERRSVVHELGIRADMPLAEVGENLLRHATDFPKDFVAEAAGLLIAELAGRPRDRGMLFLAPGVERNAFVGPLAALGDLESATEVFLATDGDTIPAGSGVTAVPLPPEVSPELTWIVRFGEAPGYALVAGRPREDGSRPVYHSADPVLVEHLTFRLRAEAGFGLRG